MNPWIAFFCGAATGSIVSLIVLSLAQASGRVPSYAKEDETRSHTKDQLDQIDKNRDQKHALIETLTKDELAMVLRGDCTLDDIMRSRELDSAKIGGKPAH